MSPIARQAGKPVQCLSSCQTRENYPRKRQRPTPSDQKRKTCLQSHPGKGKPGERLTANLYHTRLDVSLFTPNRLREGSRVVGLTVSFACPANPIFSDKGHSCAYPVNCTGTPTPKTFTDIARASSGVYGHASFPQIQPVQSWFTTSQNQTGQCAPRPTPYHATAYALHTKTSRS